MEVWWNDEVLCVLSCLREKGRKSEKSEYTYMTWFYTWQSWTSEILQHDLSLRFCIINYHRSSVSGIIIGTYVRSEQLTGGKAVYKCKKYGIHWGIRQLWHTNHLESHWQVLLSVNHRNSGWRAETKSDPTCYTRSIVVSKLSLKPSTSVRKETHNPTSNPTSQPLQKPTMSVKTRYALRRANQRTRCRERRRRV